MSDKTCNVHSKLSLLHLSNQLTKCAPIRVYPNELTPFLKRLYCLFFLKGRETCATLAYGDCGHSLQHKAFEHWVVKYLSVAVRVVLNINKSRAHIKTCRVYQFLRINATLIAHRRYFAA